MKPPRSILCKNFVYVPSAATDLRKTFAKARKLIAEQKRQQAGALENDRTMAPAPVQPVNVRAIRRKA